VIDGTTFKIAAMLVSGVTNGCLDDGRLLLGYPATQVNSVSNKLQNRRSTRRNANELRIFEALKARCKRKRCDRMQFKVVIVGLPR
jgi:hypothetical protein